VGALWCSPQAEIHRPRVRETLRVAVATEGVVDPEEQVVRHGSLEARLQKRAGIALEAVPEAELATDGAVDQEVSRRPGEVARQSDLRRDEDPELIPSKDREASGDARIRRLAPAIELLLRVHRADFDTETEVAGAAPAEVVGQIGPDLAVPRLLRVRGLARPRRQQRSDEHDGLPD